jgi:hypothetical protein
MIGKGIMVRVVVVFPQDGTHQFLCNNNAYRITSPTPSLHELQQKHSALSEVQVILCISNLPWKTFFNNVIRFSLQILS